MYTKYCLHFFFQAKAPDVLIEGEFKLDKGYSGSVNIFGKKYRESLTYNKDANLVKYQISGLAGKDFCRYSCKVSFKRIFG